MGSPTRPCVSARAVHADRAARVLRARCHRGPPSGRSRTATAIPPLADPEVSALRPAIAQIEGRLARKAEQELAPRGACRAMMRSQRPIGRIDLVCHGPGRLRAVRRSSRDLLILGRPHRGRRGRPDSRRRRASLRSAVSLDRQRGRHLYGDETVPVPHGRQPDWSIYAPRSASKSYLLAINRTTSSTVTRVVQVTTAAGQRLLRLTLAPHSRRSSRSDRAAGDPPSSGLARLAAPSWITRRVESSALLSALVRPPPAWCTAPPRSSQSS